MDDSTQGTTRVAEGSTKLARVALHTPTYYSPRLLRYHGSTPANPRYGKAKTPRTLVSGHIHGHQCTALTPTLIARLGGPDAACAHYCQIRLDVGADAYAGIACWRGEQRWAEIDVPAAYKRHYLLVRYQLDGGISLTAVTAVAREMARAADGCTGRRSRLAVATICDRTGLGRRTVTRARTTLRLLGLATEVLRGRQRSRIERMASWRVGDRARGWASEYALHPPRPVDKTRDEQGNPTQMAHHPDRGLFLSLRSRRETSLTDRAVKNRAASRRNNRRRRGGDARPPLEGSLLASRWLRERHRRAPLWTRDVTVAQWAVVLTDPARHGWTPADLNDILDQESRRLGRALTPTNPLAFMRWVLGKHDLQFPPHILDEAARAQDAAERAERRRVADAELEANRERRAIGRAAASGAARAAAMAAVPDAAAAQRHRRSREAAALAAARAELARRQR